MSRMTEDELCQIENFEIFNDDAKIIFLEPVDVRKLDLDQIVILGKKYVEIYPEKSNIKTPKPGKGLNKPATIEFYNWKMPTKYQNNPENFREKLKDWANKIKAKFVRYDERQ